MSIAKTVSAAIRRYGNSVDIICGEKTVSCKAFVEPLRRRRRMYVNDARFPIGYFDDEYKLYIGDKKYPFESDKDYFVRHDSTVYTVVTSEDFVVGDESIYIWAILMPKRELEVDGYDAN